MSLKNIYEDVVKKKIPLTGKEKLYYDIMINKPIENIIKQIYDLCKEKDTDINVIISPHYGNNIYYFSILQNIINKLNPNKHKYDAERGISTYVYYIGNNYKISKSLSYDSGTVFVISKQDKGFLKEQVIKKIPLNSIEALSRDIMFKPDKEWQDKLFDIAKSYKEKITPTVAKYFKNKDYAVVHIERNKPLYSIISNITKKIRAHNTAYLNGFDEERNFFCVFETLNYNYIYIDETKNRKLTNQWYVIVKNNSDSLTEIVKKIPLTTAKEKARYKFMMGTATLNDLYHIAYDTFFHSQILYVLSDKTKIKFDKRLRMLYNKSSMNQEISKMLDNENPIRVGNFLYNQWRTDATTVWKIEFDIYETNLYYIILTLESNRNYPLHNVIYIQPK